MIRGYRAADTDGILEVWRLASAVAHGFLDPEFLAAEETSIRATYLPNAQTWVWMAGNRVGGFIALDGHEVGALFVHPEHQRRGIGRALLNAAFERHNYLELDVFEANAGGRRFYAAAGFRTFDRYIHAETGQPMLRLNRWNPARAIPGG